MKLIEDLKEFARLLAAHEVRFLVVGGVAVNTLGYLRMTEDFDFWIDRTPENVDRLMAALEAFGSGRQFERKDLPSTGLALMAGRPPNRIDRMTSIAGPAFADCRQRRNDEDCDGIPPPVAARAGSWTTDCLGSADQTPASAGHGGPARESSRQGLDSSWPRPDQRRTRRGLASRGWTCPDFFRGFRHQRVRQRAPEGPRRRRGIREAEEMTC
jgi:hypothetical protein